MDALGAVGEGLKDPEVYLVIIPSSLGLYLITNIQHLTAAHSSSATSARVPAGSASTAGTAGTAGAPSTGSVGTPSGGSVDLLGGLGVYQQGKTSCRTSKSS